MFKKIKSAKNLSKSTDKICKVFTKMIQNLNSQIENAQESKSENLNKIEKLENECEALDGIINKCKKLSSKISDILDYEN